ncbi:uncharacterized protein DFL_009065 [Arthrobotrys flagrans]|uniref:Elongator complex protein 1 n=1 Tax=Arthrobotrys flagrans TaxID=97331 RepID=A0A436ZQL1_ARTFL|nr:hypothetical protein DFL_009065 [Arthrobotrys flagrans]
MRNLLSIRRKTHQVSSTVVPDLPLAATEWDASSNSIICAFGPSLDFPVIEINRIIDGSVTHITSWDYQGPCPKNGLEEDKILDLHYFADDLSICLVLKGGDVIVVREEPHDGQSKVEIVGSVEEGIATASWSPDESLLAIATEARTFVLMTRQFEPLADFNLTEEDLKLSKHVNVGWGKKETQFKGKRAAALRDPTMPERVDEGVLSDADTKDAKLSWRGDGQYVALSTIQDGKRRIIRVFSRSGELDGVSEPVDGMEGALSWRPSGNLIASIKRLGTDLEVIFFERNGLRHGEFPLRIPNIGPKPANLHDLEWNIDSTVLAVCLEDRIQLWTTMNYHWYLKSEIYCKSFHGSSLDSSPPRVKWHPEKTLQLSVATLGEITELEFSWFVHRGATSPPLDQGIVTVIDGSNLKLTPFRYANMPPPMSLCEIALEGNVIDVAVSPTGDSLAALTARGVDIINWDVPTLKRKAPTDVQKSAIELESRLNYRQICFFGSNKVALLYGTASIDIYQRTEGRWGKFGRIEDSQLVAGVASIILSSDGSSLLCESVSGEVVVFDEALAILDRQSHPQTCLIDDRYDPGEQKRKIFALGPSGRLFCNGKPLLNGCTSFVLTSQHLIITTIQNFLKFISLAGNIDDFQIPPEDAAGNELCRAIERGGKLVTVIPSTFAIILQMPRGNLETIYPRALVLAGIRECINSKDYKAAFSYCRTHRVDFNLLHDHNPEQFMASIDTFLEQIESVQYVDLFLSQLRDEDVSKTMYDLKIYDPAKGERPYPPPEIPNKVNKICDAILEGIQRRKSPSTQNLVTCYVSKKPADLDNGLSMISQMKANNSDDTDLAIEHICFLADVNLLYDHSLGIYDLELALLIAQQSQKDPREYLPFLQSIREMEPLRQKFFIDDFLGRHTKAANWLHEMGDPGFVELSEYTVKHDLYRHVTNLVKYDDEKRKIIVKSHAEYLMATSSHKEAGLSFEYLNSWERALDAYQKCGLWQEALYTASRIPLSNEEITELSGILADALTESKDFKNAATLYLDYRNDVREAVSSYCKGSFFQDAMRVIALKQSFNLLEEVVDPGLVEAFNTTSELIADFLAQIKSQTSRIKDLREKKENDPVAFYGASGETDAPDNVSVAGTDLSTAAGSTFTRYTDKTPGSIATNATRKTSKNRRREERKKARGKKGSVYEEEYLVNSIGRLIARVNETQEESYRIMEGLMRRGMRERAESIQVGMQSVLAALENTRKEVFDNAPAMPTGIVQANEEELEDGAGTKMIKPPDFSTIRSFQGLSIL